jgi:4-amino-4-deoxy-L-arabinose transferase-like glycosyltransferase
MQNLFKPPFSRPGWVVFLLFVLVSGFFTFKQALNPERPTLGYDERMWTSASIASYHMATGHIRNTQTLDNWFPSYAWRHKVDVFTGASWTQFDPDTIRFPYDFVTLEEVNQGNSIVVEFDTLLFPRSRFQWFDKDLWTFGWKAPNLGKYVMGAWLTWTKEVSPNGYFVYQDDQGNPSSAPFANPPSDLIRHARIPNALLTVGILAIVFLLGWTLEHWVAGLAAGLYLLFNPVFLQVNTAVGLDSFVTFFMLLSLLLLWRQLTTLTENATWKSWLPMALWSGLAMGASISSKLNGGMAMVIGGAGFLWVAYQHKDRLASFWKTWLASGAVTVATALLLFYGLNPQIQQQPVASVTALRESVDDYFEKRANILTVNQFSDRMQGIVTKMNEAQAQGILAPEQINPLLTPLIKLSQELQQNNQGDRFHKSAPKYWKRLEEIQAEIEAAGVKDLPAPKPFYDWVVIKNEFLPSVTFSTWRTLITPERPELYYGTLGLLPGLLTSLSGNDLPAYAIIPYNPLDLLWVLAGIWALYVGLKTKNEVSLGMILFAIATLLVWVGNVQFLWNDWARYFTPFLPYFGLLGGLFVGLMRRRLRKLPR